jgi:hypothetical protein
MSAFTIPSLKGGTTFDTVRFPPDVLKQEIYHVSVEETPHEEPAMPGWVTDSQTKDNW